MTPSRIVVAGGGVTGLVAAFTLREEAARRGIAIDLTLLEAGDAPGGHARTMIEDGFVVERGPNGFLDRGAETMALVDELGLRGHLVEANTVSRRRYILHEAKLRRVPESPSGIVTSDALSWRGKLRLLREPWAAAPPGGRDETVFEFAERRLGREAAETFVDTAVAGISAGDSRALSVRSQFPMLKDWEREYGSLLKAMLARGKGGRARLLSFDGGIGRLTSALGSRLNGVVRCRAAIERIDTARGEWRVHACGVTMAADRVVCAMPSRVTAPLATPFDPELSAALASIPYADMSVVALAYRADAIARPLDGYGYLVTRREGLATLGVLWESSIFPNRAPQGSVMLRVMLGGARRPEVSALDDAAVGELAIREVAPVLGITGAPLRQWVCRIPAAIAQYTVGHDARTSAIRRLVGRHRGLHVCGTAYDGVSFNDAIASARKTARTILSELVA